MTGSACCGIASASLPIPDYRLQVQASFGLGSGLLVNQQHFAAMIVIITASERAKAATRI